MIAIDQCHNYNEGLIHGDLKPGNIRLDSEGYPALIRSSVDCSVLSEWGNHRSADSLGCSTRCQSSICGFELFITDSEIVKQV